MKDHRVANSRLLRPVGRSFSAGGCDLARRRTERLPKVRVSRGVRSYAPQRKF